MNIRSTVFVALVIAAACSNSAQNAKDNGSEKLRDGLKAEEEQTIDLGPSPASSLVTWGHYVAWAATEPDRVVVYDVQSKRRNIVARATSAAAQIDYVRGDAETVVYTELARTPSDQEVGGLAVPWTDWVVDLTSGRRYPIVSQHDARPERSILPSPAIDWPWVIEAIPPVSGRPGLNVVAYDLRSHMLKTVLSGVRGLGRIDIEGEVLVYSANSREGTDLFAASIDESSPPRQVTHSGHITANKTANGGTAWREPESGDPESLWWVADEEGAKPIRFSDGGYRPYPATGFVVWIDPLSNALMAQRPSQGASQVELVSSGLDTGAGFWATQDLVVWATSIQGGHIAHLIRLRGLE